MNDKQLTKTRLIQIATKIFAEKGYHQATTREICIASDVNITAIHYYFKDKKGLYREVFHNHFKDILIHQFAPELFIDKTIHEFMIHYYSELLSPVISKKINLPHKSELFKYIHEIIAREQFEPTGLVDDLIVIPVKQIHEPLNKLLCKLFNLIQPDIEVHRLTFALVGIGFSMVHPKHALDFYAPQLTTGDDWQEVMYQRLADFATVIIESEIKKRNHQ